MYYFRSMGDILATENPEGMLLLSAQNVSYSFALLHSDSPSISLTSLNFQIWTFFNDLSFGSLRMIILQIKIPNVNTINKTRDQETRNRLTVTQGNGGGEQWGKKGRDQRTCSNDPRTWTTGGRLTVGTGVGWGRGE